MHVIPQYLNSSQLNLSGTHRKLCKKHISKRKVSAFEIWVNIGRNILRYFALIYMWEKYVVKGKDWSEASEEKRKYKVLQSYTDRQKQNVMNLTNKPNGQKGDAYVYWTLKARSEQT